MWRFRVSGKGAELSPPELRCRISEYHGCFRESVRNWNHLVVPDRREDWPADTGRESVTSEGSIMHVPSCLFEIAGIDMLDFGNLGKQGIR